MAADRLSGIAPAKINLALHVTGRRDDGYHLLDSLVVFADHGDRISVVPDDRLQMTVEGPFAGAVPPGADNLVLRAAALLGAEQGAHVTLEKHLPPASGIGGGTSDAATSLHLLARLWKKSMPDMAACLLLGADMPVCVAGRAARMAGIGERLSPVADLPPVWALLANSGVPVSTPDVFGARSGRFSDPLPDLPARWRDADALFAYLRSVRNDLEAPACALHPGISDLLDALRRMEGAAVVRMSGSGGTCFALFDSEGAATDAQRLMAAARPDVWSMVARLGHAPELPA
ncbi:4-(cytidine 5'-diphospho)-2-C-methyl-D-erythritol kinase [Oceanomicrobium pacificus]|uniref:4-diphosphocytidyl-2-C-methyl-D-erythritol kinase n=1 Tax=Oceanomicrobium pacificus TaxID=2692916 RepID=A0A6B0TJG9_9RHOB|nr:4-(cytidine 5'-diphospho)-2-C-methyl-D-erythritol kinase [Oceanomicrobium pacificus]MXU64006.1 4-(cytidine 5'-diphospho)-2-C-methyl-D-erythritol kinase [Oceanomicrobium pacificus]